MEDYREQGVSLTSLHGFDEANIGTSVQFWCLGLFLEKIQKIQNEFGGEAKSERLFSLADKSRILTSG